MILVSGRSAGFVFRHKFSSSCICCPYFLAFIGFRAPLAIDKTTLETYEILNDFSKFYIYKSKCLTYRPFKHFIQFTQFIQYATQSPYIGFFIVRFSLANFRRSIIAGSNNSVGQVIATNYIKQNK